MSSFILIAKLGLLSIILMPEDSAVVAFQSYASYPQYRNRPHKIRHASQKKLDSLYYNTAADESMYCSGRPNVPGSENCPVDKCRTNSECQSWNDRHCVCDKELCGAVCLPLNFRCEPLQHLINGRIKITPTNTISAQATYTCIRGYTLRGASVRVCQANGQWSGNTPTCDVQDKCDSPPTRKNAKHNGNSLSYDSGSTVDYECEPGFVNPVGFSNRFTALCVGKAQWRVPHFECTVRSCGHPGPLDNGRRFGGLFVYGKKVSYFCNDGYKLRCQIASERCDVRECLANGMWSGSRPTCEPIRCPKLQPPEHGTVYSSWLKVNNIVNFECNRGYRLIGSRSRRCQSDGTWDGVKAICKVQDCGRPPNIPFATVAFVSTKYKAKAAYTCARHTTTIGENDAGEMECSAQGHWTPGPPQCLLHCKVRSDDFPNGSVHRGSINGSIARGMVPSDTHIYLKCANGYRKSSHGEAKCVNGTWESVPKCTPAPCKKRPKVIHYGLARFYGRRHGDRAVYYCYVGFEMKLVRKVVKSAEIVCEYGKWLGVIPTCVKKTCPWIPTRAPLEKWLVGGGNTMKNRWRQQLAKPVHGSVVHFSCGANHRLVGYTHSVCLDGRWSPPPGSTRCLRQRYMVIPKKWLYYRRGKRR